MNSKLTREARDMATKAGLDFIALETTGGDHARLVVRRKTDSVQRFFVMALTCSDSRGPKNTLGLLRRFARGWEPAQHRRMPAAA